MRLVQAFLTLKYFYTRQQINISKPLAWSLSLHMLAIILFVYASVIARFFLPTTNGEMAVEVLQVAANRAVSSRVEPVQEKIDNKQKPVVDPIDTKIKPDLLAKKVEKNIDPKEEAKKPVKTVAPAAAEPPAPVVQSDKPKTEAATDTVMSLSELNLSLREKLNIKTQLQRCYSRAVDSNGKDSGVKIEVIATLDENGRISSNLEDAVDKQRYDSDEDYRVNVNNVRAALRFCPTIRNLPADKYDVWHRIALEFGGE